MQPIEAAAPDRTGQGREAPARPLSVLHVEPVFDGCSQMLGGAEHQDWLTATARVLQTFGGRIGSADEAPTADHPAGLHAVFGDGPNLTEHAERAFQCGLALLTQAHGTTGAAQPMTLQLGLHSSSPDSGSTQAQLHTVHHAARCIALATPNGALGLSLHSLAWVRERCEVSPAVPLQLPDDGGMLQRCVVLRERVPQDDSTPSNNHNVHAPVGRGFVGHGFVGHRSVGHAPIGDPAPATALDDALATMCATVRAVALTVVAEAGIGKSFLLQAFVARALRHPQPLHLMQAQARPRGEHQAFGLLGELLRQWLAINPTDTRAAARHKLEQGIAPWFAPEHGAEVAQGHAHVLGHLIGIDASDSPHLKGIVDDAAELRRQGWHVATTWLRMLSAQGRAPLLVVLEDLHAADHATQAFFEHLLRVNADTAMLIVASARPTLASHRPAWLAGLGTHRHIALEPLNASASRQLVAQLLVRLPQPPSELATLIVQGAGGHPLALEQRVQLLIDQGVIRNALERWSVDPRRLARATLPATLAEVVQARLTLLPASERARLHEASVMGTSFPAGVVVEAPAQTANLDHPLLQELTYASVPELTRRAMHGRLARWLVSLTLLSTDLAAGQTAHHLAQAGDALLAAEYHLRAAEFAASRHAHAEALHHVQSGLALLPSSSTSHAQDADVQALRWGLLRRRNHALKVTGQHALQAECLGELIAQAEAMDDDGKRALAHQSRGEYLKWRADYEGLKHTARQTMAYAERAGDSRTRINAMRQLAMAHRYLGDWDAAERLARQGVAQARELALPQAELPHLNVLAMVAQHRQDPVARVMWHEQELRISRATGHRRNELIAIANLGGGWLELGDLFASRRYTQQALQMTRAYGDRNVECGVLLGLSKLERWLGQAAAAQQLAREAVAIAQQTALNRWEPDARCHAGQAALDLGELDSAAEAFSTALALSLPAQEGSRFDAIAGLARVALMQGDVDMAMQHVEQLLAWDLDTSALNDALDPRSVGLTCCTVLSSAGDARAQSWLERVHGELMASAALISDEALRQGYLTNRPEHRAILSAWALARR